MEHLYIVVQRYKGQLTARSIFTERRLADTHAEILRLQDTEPRYEFFVIEGTMPTETPAEAEARLGDFNAPPKGSIADIAPEFASA